MFCAKLLAAVYFVHLLSLKMEGVPKKNSAIFMDEANCSSHATLDYELIPIVGVFL